MLRLLLWYLLSILVIMKGQFIVLMIARCSDHFYLSDTLYYLNFYECHDWENNQIVGMLNAYFFVFLVNN